MGAFEQAKAAWLAQPRFLCSRRNTSLDKLVPSPFVYPEPEKCPGGIVRFGVKNDGGWNVCMDASLQRATSGKVFSKACAAYLFGAGSDITFDLELADASRCDVYTIDPTPGLAQRLSTRQGIASLVYPKRTALIERILARGPPPNWKHVNVGIGLSDATTAWTGTKGWASSHARFLNVSVDTTVTLQSIGSLMTSLGHSRVQLVKME